MRKNYFLNDSKCFLVLLALFLSGFLFAQQNNISPKTQSQSWRNVQFGGGIGVGTLVKKNFLFSGGIKFSKFILDSYDKKEKTNSIYETDLLLGARYSFAVLDFGEQAQIEQLGLFVEGRGVCVLCRIQEKIIAPEPERSGDRCCLD